MADGGVADGGGPETEPKRPTIRGRAFWTLIRWNSAFGLDGWLAVLVLLTAISFVALGRQGSPGDWTWSLHASQEPENVQLPSVDLLLWNIVFAVLYVLAGLAVHFRTRSRTRRILLLDPARFAPLVRRLERRSQTGVVYLVVAGLADWVENVISLSFHDGRVRGAGWLVALQVSSWIKSLAFVLGILIVGLTAGAALMRRWDLNPDGPPAADSHSWNAGRANPPAEEWLPPASGQPPRAGVCLSGGGIRSASFSLGALQAIALSELRGIRYVTSVSGGGYMAAAWAALTRPPAKTAGGTRRVETSSDERGGHVPRRPFALRSAEERWVRHSTNYLVSSSGALVGACITLIGGVVINIAIVLVVFQVVAHPLGWAIREAHPEVAAKTPIVRVTRPELEVGTLVEVSAQLPSGPAACETCIPPRVAGVAYEVPLVWPSSGPRMLGIESAAAVSDPLKPLVPGLLLDVQPGLVAESDKGLVVVRQPVVSVRPHAGRRLAPHRLGRGFSTTERELRERISISKQPRLATTALPEVSGGSVGAAGDDRTGRSASRPRLSQVQQLVRIERQPVVSHRTGTVGRPPLSFPAWTVWFVLSLLGLALLPSIGWRLCSGDSYGGNQAALAIVKLATAGAVLVFAAPWVARSVPGWTSRIPGYDPSATRWRAVLGLAIAVVPVVLRFRGTLRKNVGFLKRFRGRPYVLDIALGVFVVAVGLTLFLVLVDLASANGPSGLLKGAQDFVFVGEMPDVRRWLFAAGLLVLLVVLPIPAHRWSLYTIYKSRLASAYFLRAKTDGTEKKSYRIERLGRERQRAWAWFSKAPGPSSESLSPASQLFGLSSADEQAQVDRIDEWVVCTTANIRGAGEAAPGRRAGSFTFSRSWVGGPEVGWLATEVYLARLGPSRLQDVSVPSTVAISGAAFSPAMGKASQGWRGRLFALANLRLGVWVANPMVVARHPSGNHYGKRRTPNAGWYLRELIGRFDRTAPYVYLTDGGHWENLGLVELLRRGCTDIWMISAAGDGQDTFETMAQAIALAREEIGVEFSIELEGLRSGETPDPGSRRLVRSGTAVATAPSSFRVGTFRYPGGGPVGSIHVIEAALVGDLPWDVHAYAEANADFPDIPTGYQLMNHRDFEAYRMLGYTQAARGLHHACLWPDVKDPVLGERPPR